MEDDILRITAKGIIGAILFENDVPNALDITDKIWDKLYEVGCERIGDTGIPCLVIEKSSGGTFLPVVRNLKGDYDEQE